MDFARELVENGGPNPEEYMMINSYLDLLFADEEVGKKMPPELQEILEPTLNKDTMHGFAHTKPHGYSGDFEMIDRIYQEWKSPNPKLRKWDEYFHGLAAAKAVRNRKTYFKKMLTNLTTSNNGSGSTVLNIGSGPGRDMLEFFETADNPHIKIDCVDIDENAIAHATQLCADYMDKITFHKRNIFRFRPEEKFDIVWSAGVFDYFSDRQFTVLIKRLYTYVKAGGELVIGNFSNENPSRSHMEIISDWHLQHRDEDHLTGLVIDAGVAPENIRCEQEAEGVNLFLHIAKK
ncbi:MAG: class I SAM-dependent methyltransferase [Planctomycetes bacterium]|nr:class I SAM-dependent methyltransferase [Planctomycetota bacterium]